MAKLKGLVIAAAAIPVMTAKWVVTCRKEGFLPMSSLKMAVFCIFSINRGESPVS